MISAQAIPRLAPGCRLGSGPGKDDMLLFPEGALRMNAASLQVVQRCDGSRSVQQIVSDLHAAFPQESEERLQQDVTQLLSRMLEKGVIEL